MKMLVSGMLVATMLASMTALPASASGSDNYELSCTTLTTALTTDDGNIIPAGAVAISASIDDNTGFNANTIKLDTGSNCTVITDADDNPVIEKGSVLHDAMIGMAVNNENVCVTAALDQTCTTDGDLFTIFVMPDASFSSEDVSITDVQPDMVQTDTLGMNQGMMNPGSNGTNHVIINNIIYIRRGDVNNDNVVNSQDATAIMVAYANETNKYDLTESAIMERFPLILAWYQADANGDGYTSNINANYPDLSDARTILMYAAAVGVGNPYTGYGYQTVGKWYNFFTGQQEDPNI